MRRVCFVFGHCGVRDHGHVRFDLLQIDRVRPSSLLVIVFVLLFLVMGWWLRVCGVWWLLLLLVGTGC